MLPLRDVEKSLQNHLLDGDTAISVSITGATPEQVAERLAIYSNGYRWRLLEALGADYLLLQNFLGEDEFTKLGYAYLEVYPSQHFSVDLVGQHLAKFLAETKPYSDKPFLSELARFLWALNKTIDAADAPVLTAADLAALPQDSWPDMSLKFHPSLISLTCEWNVVAIWQALANEQKLPDIIKLAAPATVIVWRKEIQSYYKVLDQKEVSALQTLQQGQTFEAVCEGLLQWCAEDEVAQQAVNLLLRWINDGIVSELKI
jgi:hypothetical protein